MVVYGVLGASLIPSEPLTVLIGAIFGPLIATLIATLGNVLAAYVEYFIGTRVGTAASFTKNRDKLPLGLGKLPVHSPAFLILGRMVPGAGPKLVSFSGRCLSCPAAALPVDDDHPYRVGSCYLRFWRLRHLPVDSSSEAIMDILFPEIEPYRYRLSWMLRRFTGCITRNAAIRPGSRWCTCTAGLEQAFPLPTGASTIPIFTASSYSINAAAEKVHPSPAWRKTRPGTWLPTWNACARTWASSAGWYMAEAGAARWHYPTRFATRSLSSAWCCAAFTWDGAGKINGCSRKAHLTSSQKPGRSTSLPFHRKSAANLMGAYHKRLIDPDPEVQLKAAQARAAWESAVVRLIPENSPKRRSSSRPGHLAHREPLHGQRPVLSRPIITCSKMSPSIQHLPCRIVHGRYDLICPVRNAFELHERLPHAELRIVPDAGHASLEPGISRELVQATQDFKSLF